MSSTAFLPAVRVPLILLVSLVLAASGVRADWPPGKFGFSRVAAYRANPIAHEISVRPTRQFVKILRPRQHQTFAYRANKQYRGVREWYHDDQSRRPTSLPAASGQRGLWYQWDMLGVPREAVIDRAVLRVRPPRRLRGARGQLVLFELPGLHTDDGGRWYRGTDRLPPTVFLSSRSWAEEAREWNTWHQRERARKERLCRKLRRGQEPAMEDMPPPPRGPVGTMNGPVLEFDVTEELRRASRGEGAHRVFQLVAHRLSHHGRPPPVIGVVYRIPVVAEAEPPPTLSD